MKGMEVEEYEEHEIDNGKEELRIVRNPTYQRRFEINLTAKNRLCVGGSSVLKDIKWLDATQLPWSCAIQNTDYGFTHITESTPLNQAFCDKYLPELMELVDFIPEIASLIYYEYAGFFEMHCTYTIIDKQPIHYFMIHNNDYNYYPYLHLVSPDLEHFYRMHVQTCTAVSVKTEKISKKETTRAVSCENGDISKKETRTIVTRKQCTNLCLLTSSNATKCIIGKYELYDRFGGGVCVACTNCTQTANTQKENEETTCLCHCLGLLDYEVPYIW